MPEGGDQHVLPWLMRGDVAIRWQVQRDLLRRPAREWRAEQGRVGKDGWGARILARQNPDGRWTPKIYGQKWISTTYSMMLLRQLGLPRDDPRAITACPIFLDEGQCADGGINVNNNRDHSETCISGLVLTLLSWFKAGDRRRERLVEYLLEEQMDDGGWNCMRHRGARHASFHTTINVLEGLRDYVEARGPSAADALKAEAGGREFFLAHRLYRSHRTGRVVTPAFRCFSFPPRWHHDVMRTLDYFRAAGAPYDERLDDPIGLVESRRGSDGRWILQNRYPGKTFFEMETPGKPSRWNTLRGLRILDWYEKARR